MAEVSGDEDRDIVDGNAGVRIGTGDRDSRLIVLLTMAKSEQSKRHRSPG